MTLPLPNLDDRTYADLVEEAISQISVEYPEWTDHNPTDTGIILIELLAWLTEMTLYQVNQIPDENYVSFLRLLRGGGKESLLKGTESLLKGKEALLKVTESLLKGTEWKLPDGSAEERHKSLQLAIKDTLLSLRHRYRGVTLEDYEKLVLEDWNKSLYRKYFNILKIARVKGLAKRNLEKSDVNTFVAGHISLVVVPTPTENNQETQYDTTKLLEFLEPRKLLTTRLHIVEAEYVSISIKATLIPKDDVTAEHLIPKAEAELKLFFAPLDSGKYWEGKGWPFGRSIYLSEVYKLLDDLAGVDYVKNILIQDENNQPFQSQDGQPLPEIYLADNQLVKLELEDNPFVVEDNPFTAEDN